MISTKRYEVFSMIFRYQKIGTSIQELAVGEYESVLLCFLTKEGKPYFPKVHKNYLWNRKSGKTLPSTQNTPQTKHHLLGMKMASETETVQCSYFCSPSSLSINLVKEASVRILLSGVITCQEVDINLNDWIIFTFRSHFIS